MAWGQPHTAGTGSTGQIEDAHKALDAVGVAPGPLAIRAISAAGVIDRLRSDRQRPRFEVFVADDGENALRIVDNESSAT